MIYPLHFVQRAAVGSLPSHFRFKRRACRNMLDHPKHHKRRVTHKKVQTANFLWVAFSFLLRAKKIRYHHGGFT